MVRTGLWLQKITFLWYNECDLKRKQVRFLYEPVAVKHVFGWFLFVAANEDTPLGKALRR